MSTVTTHTLFSRAARYSAGASSLRCPKPAVVSLPYARNSGKKTSRSLCYYADPKSIDHPSNIPPFALVHPVMPPTPTRTFMWEIKEHDMKVELTFFSMPNDSGTEDFRIAVEGDVLVIKKEFKSPHDGIWFHVRLLVPELYDKEKIKAELERRNLVVIIPKLPTLPEGSKEVPFHRKVVKVEKKD